MVETNTKGENVLEIGVTHSETQPVHLTNTGGCGEGGRGKSSKHIQVRGLFKPYHLQSEFTTMSIQY